MEVRKKPKKKKRLRNERVGTKTGRKKEYKRGEGTREDWWLGEGRVSHDVRRGCERSRKRKEKVKRQELDSKKRRGSKDQRLGNAEERDVRRRAVTWESWARAERTTEAKLNKGERRLDKRKSGGGKRQ